MKGHVIYFFHVISGYSGAVEHRLVVNTMVVGSILAIRIIYLH